MSKIVNIEESDRPREKALKSGLESLTNAEILAIFIRCGIRGKSAIELAQDILDYYGTLRKLLNTDIYDLMKIKGIKKAKALELLAAIELSKRLSLEEYRKISNVKSAEEVYYLVKSEMENEIQEKFVVIYLNIKLNIIKKEILFIGGSSSSLVDVSLLFKKAIMCGAKKIICVHNHPSGDSNPSDEDIILTDKIRKVGELVKICLLDHIIIGKNNYFSFAREGI